MEKCRYYRQSLCYGQRNAPEVFCHGDLTECTANPPSHYLESPYSIFKTHFIIAMKEYTNDYIKCYLEDDDLTIEIYYHHQLNYIYKEISITSKIISGISAEQLAEKIAKQYRDILLYRHFKKKF